MRTLLFTIFSLVCLNSLANAEYESWGAAEESDQIAINTSIIQMIEKNSSSIPVTKISNLTILSKKYKLVLKDNQDYLALKKLYSRKQNLTASVELDYFLKHETLHLLKDTSDQSILKAMNYRLSIPGEVGCSFYIIPLATYNRLSPDSLTSLQSPQGALPADLPKITYFGSCRIHLPFMEMFKDKKIIFNNGLLPRNHFTVPEALQMLKIAHGELPLPEARFRDLLWCSPQMRTFELMKYPDTEVFIAEFCTLREFKLDGYFLHHTRLMQNLFQKPYKDGDVITYPLMPYYSFLVKEAEKRAGFINPFSKRKPSPQNLWNLTKNIPEGFLTEDDLYILENLEVNVLTEFDYIENMRKFSEFVGGKPVIFISHVNAKGVDDNSIYQRELIDRYIQKGAKEIGQFYFRPADLIMRQYGQDNALVSREDISHYTPEFLKVIGEAYLEKIQEVLSND